MSQPHLLAAQILETSASAYAGYAASLLLERHAGVGKRYGPSAMADWKAGLTQRVLELAAAVAAEEPKLFTSRVQWVERSFRARELESGDLRAALDCLRQVLQDELPETGRDEVDRCLDLALESLGGPAPAGEPAAGAPGLDPAATAERLALRYLQTVLEGDSRRAVELVVRAVQEGLSPQDAYLGVLLAAQREVGHLWHVGELSIAEEHLVTSTTERAMAVLAQRATRAEANGKTVIAAAVAGNSHGLGPRILADFFEIAGWRAICLGADVPPTELATAVVYFDADLLVLSAALSTHLKTVRQTIDAIRLLPGREVKILAGGVAFAETPDLWQRLGADGHAPTADAAVSLGARLVGLA